MLWRLGRNLSSRFFIKLLLSRGDGMKYALAYNEFHNLESIGIEGKDESLIKYAYKNGNGRLKQMTYANGHTMKAVYNSIGQMVAEKWFETEAQAASSTATPIAHYKYVYDGDGNIVRSIDISGKKEYNYEYEEGRIVRSTEADIELSGEIVTSKVIVNTVIGVAYLFIVNPTANITYIFHKRFTSKISLKALLQGLLFERCFHRLLMKLF